MSTEPDWFTTILKMIDEVRTQGHEPTKIIIPRSIQLSMQRAFLPPKIEGGKEAKGAMTFYGIPVEDGPEIAVEWNKRGYDDQHYILSIMKEK